MNNYDDTLNTIKLLVRQQQAVAKKAYLIYEPQVLQILHTKSKDIMCIQSTLDHILDFCFDSEMLLLYRKLCIYYYDIDEQATLEYVKFYREMWDEEEKNFGSEK